MFDIDRAISDWRRQMVAGGLKAEVLDELESHLRDEAESQVRAGVSGQLAFEAAVQRLGQARVLKKEFGKGRRNRLGVIMMRFALACTVLGGLWYWFALRVAVAVISVVPGSAGLFDRSLTRPLLLFWTGVALLLAAGVSLAAGRRWRAKPVLKVAP